MSVRHGIRPTSKQKGYNISRNVPLQKSKNTQTFSRKSAVANTNPFHETQKDTIDILRRNAENNMEIADAILSVSKDQTKHLARSNATVQSSLDVYTFIRPHLTQNYKK